MDSYLIDALVMSIAQAIENEGYQASNNMRAFMEQAAHKFFAGSVVFIADIPVFDNHADGDQALLNIPADDKVELLREAMEGDVMCKTFHFMLDQAISDYRTRTGTRREEDHD